jgi:hypothetical protein
MSRWFWYQLLLLPSKSSVEQRFRRMTPFSTPVYMVDEVDDGEDMV